MATIQQGQEVKLFADGEVIGIQTVLIDTKEDCEPWINVMHDGSELTMSLHNWNKLVGLVETVKSIING